MIKSVKIEDQCPNVAEEEINHCNKIDPLFVHQQDKNDYDRALFFALKVLYCFLEEKKSEGDTKLNFLCAHKYKARC